MPSKFFKTKKPSVPPHANKFIEMAAKWKLVHDTLKADHEKNGLMQVFKERMVKTKEVIKNEMYLKSVGIFTAMTNLANLTTDDPMKTFLFAAGYEMYLEGLSKKNNE